MATMRWKTTWLKDETHATGWDSDREALRRDWQQTKHDLHVGGHELNQNVKDTVKQMSGKEAIPPVTSPNPPKVIGDFDEAELPMEYGYGARRQFGSDRFSNVEPQLRSEWDRTAQSHGRWDDVRDYVRRGYEYRGDRSSTH